MKMKPIRLIYQEDCFDTEIMDIRFKERLKVEKSGVCVFETYERRGKGDKFEKISAKKQSVSEEEISVFLEKVELFIENATLGGIMVDDCSAYVKLKYPGIEITATRELVDENDCSLDSVIREFMEKVCLITK